MKYWYVLFPLLCLENMTSLSAADSRPNVLFIMADDHTTQAFGVYGSRLAGLNPTPNIDALAKKGMRFDRVFCNNSICTPSRASILTGQYPQTNGVLDLTGRLPPDRQHLPRLMGDAGYETAMIGKWHLREEPAAFDYYCVLPGQGRYYDPTFRVSGDDPWPQNAISRTGHSSDVVTDISLEWLRRRRGSEKPFFLMHHFKAPHDMFNNAERYDDYLEDVQIPEPENLHNQPSAGFGSAGSREYGAGVTKNHPSWGLGRRLRVSENLKKPNFGKTVYQRYLKRYLRCVKGVDDNVKRLIDELRDSGELGNTIIFYTGDQGFFLGEHDFMDKRWIYEEAMRMPFIVHWPDGIKVGSVNNWLINNTDFAPTILTLAGASVPDGMQGCSFAGALHGKPKPADWRTGTYYRYWMHMAHQLRVPAHFGLRTDKHKLIFFYGCTPDGKNNTPAAWEFYDLTNDPFEMQNEYNNPKFASIIAKLKNELRSTRNRLNETDEAYPAIQTIVDAHWSK